MKTKSSTNARRKPSNRVWRAREFHDQWQVSTGYVIPEKALSTLQLAMHLGDGESNSYLHEDAWHILGTADLIPELNYEYGLTDVQGFESCAIQVGSVTDKTDSQNYLTETWEAVLEGPNDFEKAIGKCKKPTTNDDCLITVNTSLSVELCAFFNAWINYKIRRDALDIDWALNTSKVMAQILESADWKEPTWMEAEVLHFFSQFHKSWLRYCIDRQDFTHVPTIINALQGRKLARLLLDELDDSELSTDPPESVLEFKGLRRRLRELALEIRVLTDRGVTVEIERTNQSVASSQSEKDSERLGFLIQEQNATMSRLPMIRGQVAALSEYEHLAIPYKTIDIPVLRSFLRPYQALLLLIDLGDTQIAWVLHPNRSIQLLPLSLDLATLTAQMGACDMLAPEAQPLRMRGGPVVAPRGKRDIGSTAFKGWDWLKSQMQNDLWLPLESALTGVTELYVVTHGRYHSLPLSLGNLHAHHIVHFPGLLFFLKAMETDWSPPPPGHLAFAYKGKDLPLASHEGELLALTAWRESFMIHNSPPLPGAPIPIRLAIFSGHGSSDPDRPENTCLMLDEQGALSFHDIVEMVYKPRGVILSACVAGQTIEDRDGDPLGPVTAFMLCGTRQVMACISPVPDAYMPLLVMLTETTALREKLSLRDALAKAKSLLGSWTSEPALKDLVQPYRSWLENSMQTYYRNELASQNQGMPETIRCNNMGMLLENLRSDSSDASLNADINNLQQRLKNSATNNSEVEWQYLSLIDTHCLRQSELLMIPPHPVIDLLTNVVKVFG